MDQLKMYHTLECVEDYPIPEGFELRTYKDGEYQIWADICKNGLLNEESDAAEMFKVCILNRTEIVPEKDIFFICREGSEPEATLTAYVNSDNVGDVHMVAAKPSIRGNNVNRMMLAAGLKKLDKEIKGEKRLVYLTTDDFRIPAIVGYLKAGFQPVIYAEGMVERWQKICDDLNMHGIEMLNNDGSKSGVIL